MSDNPAAAQDAKPDYELIWRVPPQYPSCNKSWFNARFELARGKERFAKPTWIELAVMPDGAAGFVLDLLLRSEPGGIALDSTRKAYAAPIECTQVVADAAEITLEMMRGHRPEPLHVPKSPDYEVEIDAPDSLAACRNTGLWRKFFEVARGNTRFLAPYPKRIELLFEGDSARKIVVKAVLRQDTGVPLLANDGQRLDDVRRAYPSPIDCTQALAYSAQSISNLIPVARPVNPSPPPPPTPTPERTIEMGTGFIVQQGVLGNNLEFGLHLSFLVPLRPFWALNAKLDVLHPHDWSGIRGIDFGAATSLTHETLGICWTPRDFFGACGNLRVGQLTYDFTHIEAPSQHFAFPVSLGPSLYIQSSRMAWGGLRLRLGGSLMGNISTVGAKNGPLDADAFLKPSWISWTLEAALIVPLGLNSANR